MSLMDIGGTLLDKAHSSGDTFWGTLTNIGISYLADNYDLSALGISGSGGYRPRQWGGIPSAQLVYCKTNVGGLFFDAVLNVSTTHSAVITSHPVQTGANISDHMYLEPVQISMEIGMSDAMDSMVQGQWMGAYTKSVSAYRKLCELQAARIPFTVMTRLNAYKNMVIKSISVPDDYTTQYALKATIELQQLLIATVATEKVSARQWSSGSGQNNGEVQPAPVPESVLAGVTGESVDGSVTGRGKG
ncbi:phage baseplate protein [uncultured Dialister sp.]|uniref:phage baseplate protein n=1 Tax=uncultured Dialister sp. TaxID=278064 RepID=UPI0026DBE984|nr:hypothetical protein [uncultured Dialister sp.]